MEVIGRRQKLDEQRKDGRKHRKEKGKRNGKGKKKGKRNGKGKEKGKRNRKGKEKGKRNGKGKEKGKMNGKGKENRKMKPTARRKDELKAREWGKGNDKTVQPHRLGVRTEEGSRQGKERGRDWKRRNSRVHSEGTEMSAVGEAKQRWQNREKSSLRQTAREGIAQRE